MALELIRQISGRAVHVPGEDIDTDRIIPARFLKCVTFDGLGEHLFRDVRFAQDGSKTEHPLNDARHAGATVLVCGRNFGCGSSREHAPQSIAKAGFKAVVAESFAEIFFGNSVALGIPCVSLARSSLDALAARVDRDPRTVVTIDLEAQILLAGEGKDAFRSPLSIKDGAREALLSGRWDPIGQLLEGRADILGVAKKLPYLRSA
jgi:3-isopropylmalate/(R)-2-methylmalate dehydratase small subunit